MIINYTDYDLDLLARIMRAEALGEGDIGMLMVGNVIVNRVIASCLTFKNIKTIYDAVFQKNQFSGINNSLFQGKATKKEKELAKRVLSGEYYYPATNSLWFCVPQNKEICDKTWYNQILAGKYKNHCFYVPEKELCQEIK